MKILSLKLKNNFLGWDFDEVDFSSNLTLLVGVSGAGKTQILRGIIDLSRIANGKTINGLEWKIRFSTVNNTEFIWEGCFDTVDIDGLYMQDEDETEKSPLLYEKITSKDTVLVERNEESNQYQGNPIPKLSSHQSMIYLLREESAITEIFNALNKIEYRDHTRNGSSLMIISKKSLPFRSKYTTLENIINSNEDIKTKLYLVYENKLDIFKKIKSNFMDVFQQIEDIKLIPLKMKGIAAKWFGKIPVIYIKEKSVSKWIREDRVSSGMMRTLIHLSEIFLSSEGTVILIDEFENSLGINCIDILTDDLIHENKTLQFIATSHHPYIINNIPYEYWKIITRRGGHINIRNASDYNLGKSKQDAFIQLTRILEKQA
jgi:predicted ATPase